ncbi:7-dehydrocholesterol reductase, partial [Caligus rogercresseyi]
GTSNPEAKGDPDQDNLEGLSAPYLFYRGIELHPRVLDVDVKQWTNSRVGCWDGQYSSCPLRPGPLVHAILILVYLFKFFYWETGYFNTLDITLDRAGYYLCWGCLVWVQCFYTFASYYMVSRPNLNASWFGHFRFCSLDFWPYCLTISRTDKRKSFVSPRKMLYLES